MRQDYPVIDCDVLVIGGGSAGAMAAIRAKEVDPNQKVVIFEKGEIKYSGCIARGMDAGYPPQSYTWNPTAWPAKASWMNRSTIVWSRGAGSC